MKVRNVTVEDAVDAYEQAVSRGHSFETVDLRSVILHISALGAVMFSALDDCLLFGEYAGQN